MRMQDVAQGSAEDRLIERYFRPIASHPGAFGLADDAAALAPPPGCDIVLTTDSIISGVHFFPDDPPDTVARKALRINLSDLAAKGAAPFGFLLSIALPENISAGWLEEFARGLREDAAHYGCPLLGGDTDKSPGTFGSPGGVTVHIAALGTVPHGTMVRRAGAAPQHQIVVTGTIGDAALGLLLCKDRDAAARWGLDQAMTDHLIGRYRLPQPRNAIAAALRRHAAAALDVSDGLVGDVAKLARASGIAAEIAVALVPLSAAARQALSVEPGLMEAILSGGDDYEVVAAVDAGKLEALRAEASSVGIALTTIGMMTAGPPGARFRMADGSEVFFTRPSYSHF
jgi:thiamine-monophosphate kinase